MFKDLNICDEFTPVDVKDSAKAALVETFKESDMTEVCDPGLGAIEKRGEYYGLVFTDLDLDLQVVVVPDPFIQSAEGTACLG